jgi:hypothetical protein
MSERTGNDKEGKGQNTFSTRFSRKDNDGFHKKSHGNRRDHSTQKSAILHAYKWQGFSEDELFEDQDREYTNVLTARNRVSI